MMFKKRIKRVLVIGHKGFIGSHLMASDLSIDKDYVLTGIDIKDGPLGDVKSETWQENKYDFIVFLACNFWETLEGYVDNSRMLAAVGRYLEIHQRTRIIYTSSAAVYPAGYRSMKETDTAATGAPTYYGQGKLLGEMGLEDQTILRLANVYGEGGRGVVDLIKAGNQVIYGTGMQVRDFIPVNLVISTIVDAIHQPKKWRGVFNVSTNIGLTVLHIYKDYGQGSPIFRKARPKDVKFSVLDNTKWLNQWK